MQDARVIPLLLDLDKKEISGPLAQFQAKKVEKGEIRELIFSVNKSAKNPVPDGSLERLFVALWPDLESRIAAIPKAKEAPKPPRPEGEILEELVAGIRNLETRLVVMKKVDGEGLEMQLREIHAKLMHAEEAALAGQKARVPRLIELRDMSRRLADGPGDPLQVLILAGFIRDDAPWFYELAIELYRAIKSGSRAETADSQKRIRDALIALSATPLAEEMKRDWKMLAILFDEALSNIDYVELGEGEGAKAPLDPALQAVQDAFEVRTRK
jgi:hypothetical protein